jgi:glutamate formiminotransferase
VLEAVPNVSEGRDLEVVAAIGAGFGAQGLVLDVHADPDHNRSVYTVAADDERIVASMLEGVAAAVERIDLRAHEGVHPRVGAADVVPIVPLAPGELERACAAALTLARRIGDELRLPVFRYGGIGNGRGPAFFRRGGLAALRERIDSGELEPDDGPRAVDPRSGVVLVGARAPLVAYNLDLATDDVGVARAVAAAVRESSGGMPGLQAIGLLLPGSGRVQVSMNVVDIDRAPLHAVVERVREQAAAHGASVERGELVGLVPQRVVREAATAGVALPGIDESQVLENVLRSRLGE